ncbi:MAG TPA: hypothetical protein VKC59_00725, partial [Candidatus Limnocylindrales bacterium]|nr:hypothetical protein [Candidatus Limnocylindrales bacterium]
MSGSAIVIEAEPAEDRAANRAAARRGWILWLAAVLPAMAGLALIAGSVDAPLPESFGFRGDPALLALSFGSVGAFVLTRRPGNRVGAILIAIGVNSGVLGFFFEYANVGLFVAPGSLPGAVWAAWLASWIYVPLVILAGPLLLSVYPDGRFLSLRWRAVAIIGVAFGLLRMFVLAFGVGPLENFSTRSSGIQSTTGFFVDNPAGVLPRSIGDPMLALSNFGVVLTFGACAASLIVRFRAADRDGRQQLKWFAVAALALAATAPLGFLGRAGGVAFILVLCTLPVATGLAVLRYGLYEIDTVINRAIVYGLLTAVLAGIYTASIGVMQRLSKSVTGADSDAAIVVTTLLVVIAFTPIKGRLQAFVDRRFKENRDPAHRLDEFVKEVAASLSSLDPPRTLRRFLGVVVDACDLP